MGLIQKGLTDAVSDVLLEVWIPKGFAQLVIESREVANVIAPDKLRNLSDFPGSAASKGLRG